MATKEYIKRRCEVLGERYGSVEMYIGEYAKMSAQDVEANKKALYVTGHPDKQDSVHSESTMA